ncbi:phage holin family protein [candidate division WWE3 bacterium]|nr:phage holin family protein [candidate division WWE3 bacterium]
MKMLSKWLISALSLMIVSVLLPGFRVESFYTALIVAFLLGILNAVVRPILVLLTLPINILTLGLFTFVINAGLIVFVSTFVKGFSVDFSTALIASILLWIISLLANLLIRD